MNAEMQTWLAIGVGLVLWVTGRIGVRAAMHPDEEVREAIAPTALLFCVILVPLFLWLLCARPL